MHRGPADGRRPDCPRKERPLPHTHVTGYTSYLLLQRICGTTVDSLYLSTLSRLHAMHLSSLSVKCLFPNKVVCEIKQPLVVDHYSTYLSAMLHTCTIVEQSERFDIHITNRIPVATTEQPPLACGRCEQVYVVGAI
jgi:hypothetical protein